MTSDNPSQPASTEHKGPDIAPAEAKPEVEYDDFGLPVRKRRPRTPIEDSDDEGDFTDAVAGADTAASQVNVAADNAKDTNNTAAEESAREPEYEREAGVSNNAQPQANGVKVEEVEVGPEDEGKKSKVDAPEDIALKEAKADVPENVSNPEATGKLDSESPNDTKDTAHNNLQSATIEGRKSLDPSAASHQKQASVSEYSHQHTVSQPEKKEEEEDFDDGGWQTMPAYARYDIYDDDNRLIAKENPEELEDMHGYGNVGGAAKGYTRVILDDDADSQTSMDDNTAYLFKEKTTA